LWGLLLSVPVAASVQVVLFRVFPKLTTPTPLSFLRAQGLRSEEADSAKILEGEEHRTGESTPEREPSELASTAPVASEVKD
jgi:hypothetical protein